MSNEQPLLMRVNEVSHALGLSRGAVYALISEGSLPSVKIGRSRRVAAADLEAWVRDRLAHRDEGSDQPSGQLPPIATTRRPRSANARP